jgi:exonuclease III
MGKVKVLSMNCNSIKGKLDLIKANVETYKPDLIAVTETKIGENFDDNEFLGNKYTLYRNDRKKGAGGTLFATSTESSLVILNTSYGPGAS